MEKHLPCVSTLLDVGDPYISCKAMPGSKANEGGNAMAERVSREKLSLLSRMISRDTQLQIYALSLLCPCMGCDAESQLQDQCKTWFIAGPGL